MSPVIRLPIARDLRKLRRYYGNEWRPSGPQPNGFLRKQRTVFLLRFVEDMDLLEIAVATGMKEGTVKTHLFRALRAVRERIGEAI